jgi:hypothetical protein
MLTQIKKQPSVQGVVADSIGVARIPTVATHYACYLECMDDGVVSDDALADVERVVVKINGDTIIDATPAALLMLQKYYGDAIGSGNLTGIIPIIFYRPTLLNFPERSVYALGMADVQSFTIDVHFGTLSHLTSINVYSEVTNENRYLGKHVRFLRNSRSFGTYSAAAGLSDSDCEITDLPKEGPGVAYLALHLYDPQFDDGTAANRVRIRNYNVKVDGNDIIDEVSPEIMQVILERNRRTVQTDWHHIPFDVNDELARSLLPMAGVKDFRLKLKFYECMPGPFDIYSEQVFGIPVTVK